MSVGGEYQLLCLENPLLGMASIEAILGPLC